MKLERIAELLRELGAEPIGAGGADGSGGAGAAAAGESGPGIGEALWRLGGSTLSIAVEGDVVRVSEVLASTRSLPAVLDAIANVAARQLPGATRGSDEVTK